MPMKLINTIEKIQTVPNSTNREVLNEFLEYMKDKGSSYHHQNNNLKIVIPFAIYLGPSTTFYEVDKREQILSFLNMKIKTHEVDPDKRWITTWNNYLNRIRLFYRWLYNKDSKDLEHEYWQTPDFVKIKCKRSKRISPYLESEIWEKHELNMRRQ